MDILGHLARAFDYEKDPNPNHWKTINGAHVHMDGNGQIDGGAGGQLNGQPAHGKTPQQPAGGMPPQNQEAERQRMVNELAEVMAEEGDYQLGETSKIPKNLPDNPTIEDLKNWWTQKVKASKVGMKKSATPEMHDKWANILKQDLQAFKDGMAKAGVSMAEIGKHNFDEMLKSADVSFWEKMDGALGDVPKAALKNWEKLKESPEWKNYLASKGQTPAEPEPPADPLGNVANAFEPPDAITKLKAIEAHIGDPFASWMEFKPGTTMSTALEIYPEYKKLNEVDKQETLKTLELAQKAAMAWKTFTWMPTEENYKQLMEAAKEYNSHKINTSLNTDNVSAHTFADLGGQLPTVSNLCAKLMYDNDGFESAKDMVDTFGYHSIGMTKLPDGYDPLYGFFYPDGENAENVQKTSGMPVEPDIDVPDPNPLAGLANATEPPSESKNIISPDEFFAIDQESFAKKWPELSVLNDKEWENLEGTLAMYQLVAQYALDYKAGKADYQQLKDKAKGFMSWFDALDWETAKYAEKVFGDLGGNLEYMQYFAKNLTTHPENQIGNPENWENVGMTEMPPSWSPKPVNPTTPAATEPNDPLTGLANATEPPHEPEAILNWKEFMNFSKIKKALMKENSSYAELEGWQQGEVKTALKAYQKTAMALNAYLYNNQSANFTALKKAAKELYNIGDGSSSGGWNCAWDIFNDLGGNNEKMWEIADAIHNGAGQHELHDVIKANNITNSMGMTKLPGGLENNMAKFNPDGSIEDPMQPTNPPPAAQPAQPAQPDPLLVQAQFAKKLKEGWQNYLTDKGITHSNTMFDEFYATKVQEALDAIQEYKDNPDGNNLTNVQKSIAEMAKWQKNLSDHMGNKVIQHGIENYFDSITGKGTMKALKELQAATQNGNVDIFDNLQAKMGSIKSINKDVVDPIGALANLPPLATNGGGPYKYSDTSITTPEGHNLKAKIAGGPFTFEPQKYPSVKMFVGKKQSYNALSSIAGKAWNAATQEEKAAGYLYTHSYTQFNDFLRGLEHYGSKPYIGIGNVDFENADASYAGKGTVKKRIQALTKLIDRAEAPYDIKLRRGVYWEGMDKYFGIPMNVLKSGDVNKIKSAIMGKEFYDGGFMSCGSSEGTGFNGNFEMEILAPKGTKMMYVEDFSHYGKDEGPGWNGQTTPGYTPNGENESILQRGTYVVPVDVKIVNGKLRICCQVTRQQPYDI